MVTGLVKAGYFREVMSRPQPRDLRASDADRERVVAVLAEAAADGRLTLDEHTERVHRAYRARTLGELSGLTEDLAAPSAQPLRLDGTRSVAAFFTTQRREGRWVMPDRSRMTDSGTPRQAATPMAPSRQGVPGTARPCWLAKNRRPLPAHSMDATTVLAGRSCDRASPAEPGWECQRPARIRVPHAPAPTGRAGAHEHWAAARFLC